MSILAQLISWLNAIGNGLFGLLDKLMVMLPLWLSLTVISAVLGVVMLILFKYTSNQTAIGRVRDAIKAHLLAMKLFKDNIPVVLKAEGKILLNVLLLLAHSLRPMLIMIVPITLFLMQLGLWYQFRPLAVGEQTVLTMQLADSDEDFMPQVSLQPAAAAVVTAGPVRVPSKRQIFWQIQAVEPGSHQLTFQVDDQQVQKQLAVGDGPMFVSATRPGSDIADLIQHPAEKPFDKTSPVRWIQVNYSDRFPAFLGAGIWIWGIFLISIAAGFILKPFFNVKF